MKRKTWSQTTPFIVSVGKSLVALERGRERRGCGSEANLVR
jgi:hypothetical protein